MIFSLLLVLTTAAAPLMVRRDIRTLEATEIDTWVRKIEHLKSSGMYDAITAIHANETEFNLVHHAWPFLPWHRSYVSLMEALMEQPMPYWDSSADAGRESDSFIWSLLGGIGTTKPFCVPDGPFVNWTTYQDGRCLKRSGTGVSFWNASRIHGVMYGPRQDFSRALEDGPHFAVHNWVGGSMAGFGSPDDPVFWLHHAFVDMLWHTQQVYNDPMIGVPPDKLDSMLPSVIFPTVTPRQVLLVEALGYTYDRTYVL